MAQDDSAPATPGKRLILLLDGTWNDDELNLADTNIVRLRERIADFIRENAEADKDTSGKRLSSRSTGGVSNLVFYERGVGTGRFLDEIVGGAFGEGLDTNVRRAYNFLSFYYQPGDEIYIFGFSRGAYTARSLAGYIGASGLLRRDRCTTELEAKAWTFYRTPPNDRLAGNWLELTPHMHDRTALKIKCLGVFDTVGALGVPLPAFRRANRERFQFHDVTLSSIVDVNLHAVAVDEHREPFQATLWRRPKFKVYNNAIVEQVWFAGAHADIGGGYFTIEERRKTRAALDDIAISWMTGRVLEHCPGFPVAPPERPRRFLHAKRHEARIKFYRWFAFALRSIGNEFVEAYRWFRSSPVSYDRLDAAMDEMVHVSVLQRASAARLKHGPYRPANFEKVLSRIERTYGVAQPDALRLPLADWTGNVVQEGTLLHTDEKEHILPIVDWNGKMLFHLFVKPKDDAERERQQCDIRRARLLIRHAQNAFGKRGPLLWRLRRWFWEN